MLQAILLKEILHHVKLRCCKANQLQGFVHALAQR